MSGDVVEDFSSSKNSIRDSFNLNQTLDETCVDFALLNSQVPDSIVLFKTAKLYKTQN